jgi:WD40 repeat protein
MKTRIALTIPACLLLWVSCAGAADLAAAKQSLAIPVSPANRVAGSVDCVVNVGPVTPVTAAAFSPDGKMLASAGYREVLLWDLAAAKLSRRLPAGGNVGALAFLKDGSALVVGEGSPSVSGAVRLIELASGKETCRFGEPKDVVRSLAVSPDGKLLAASASGSLAYVWNLDQKKLATTIQGHSDRILHASFSPNGKFLATGGEDNTCQIWNVADWTLAAKFVEVYPVYGAAFHPDEVQVLLAVGGPDGSGLRFRKTDTPTFRRPIAIGPAVPLGMIGPSKAGRVYVPCTDKTVKVIDIRNGGQLATLRGHQDWVYAVALSADETTVAAAGGDGTVRLWSARDNRPLATLVQLAPQADRWLIVTAQGHMATSSAGAVKWKCEKLSTPPDQLTAQLLKPNLVARTMAGEKVPAPTLK